MRTNEEIVERCNNYPGWICKFDLIERLPFDVAKQFLTEDALADAENDWREKPTPNTREAILERMRDYMPFALGKAEDHRGLSANRSIEHYHNWLWLLGDDKTLAFAEDDDNYPQYGVPILKHVCEVYGFQFPENACLARMADGEPCDPDCDDGCGS